MKNSRPLRPALGFTWALGSGVKSQKERDPARSGVFYEFGLTRYERRCFVFSLMLIFFYSALPSYYLSRRTGKRTGCTGYPDGIREPG